jgi:hypothetical protein
VARCLLIGCGCRALGLAGHLLAEGHAVRGTTRHAEHAELLAAAAVEPWVGDPDRVATLAPALEHVTVAAILLGSASGPPDRLAELHGSRLEMLLSQMLDTTVRGILYEASGSVASDLLRAGGGRVRAACEGSCIPFRLLEADPADHRAWVAGARSGISALLQGRANLN